MSELHRFARQLVESIGAHEPAALGAPVALEDIVSRVLPYRVCRRLFGILNVEDYELLLLRLLAGEDGLASGAPPAAVERCRAELETGHPDPGILEELEDASIRLQLGAIALGDRDADQGGGLIIRSYSLSDPEPTPEPVPAPLPEPAEVAPAPEAAVPAEPASAGSSELVAPSPEPPREDGVEFEFLDTRAHSAGETLPSPEPPVTDEAPDAGADPFQELFDEPGEAPERELLEARQIDSPPPRPDHPPPPAAHGDPPPRCPQCASRLPSGRPVRFCPHCGSNIVPLQCGSCGADLEPAWRHCVLCGAPAVNDSRFA